MGPRLSPGVTAWSRCSRLQLSQFLTSYGECLYNSPRGRDQQWDHEDGRLPGERYGSRWEIFCFLHIDDTCKGLTGTPNAIWCTAQTGGCTPAASSMESRSTSAAPSGAGRGTVLGLQTRQHFRYLKYWIGSIVMIIIHFITDVINVSILVTGNQLWSWETLWYGKVHAAGH